MTNNERLSSVWKAVYYGAWGKKGARFEVIRCIRFAMEILEKTGVLSTCHLQMALELGAEMGIGEDITSYKLLKVMVDGN